MSEKVVAVRKDGNGYVMAVKTDGSHSYQLPEAIAKAQLGQLDQVQAWADNHSGSIFLRSDPRVAQNQNLLNLPNF